MAEPKMHLHDEIEKRFTYHPPKDDQPMRYAALRATAKQLAEMINDLCPACREQALAMTKLEESIFWANAAIARRE